MQKVQEAEHALRAAINILCIEIQNTFEEKINFSPALLYLASRKISNFHNSLSSDTFSLSYDDSRCSPLSIVILLYPHQ